MLLSVGEMDLHWILFRFSYSHKESVSHVACFIFFMIFMAQVAGFFFPVGGMRNNEDWPLSKSDWLCGASGSATTL